MASINKEFSRMRSIVLKRIQRLGPERLTREGQQILQYGLPKIADIKARHKPGEVSALTLNEELEQYIQYFKYLYNWGFS